jgi:hypothetical protein
MNRPALSLLCGLVCLLTGPGAASAVEITADAGDCKVSSLPLDPSNALAGIRLSRTSFFGVTRELLNREHFDSGGCRLSSPVDVLVRLKVKPSGEASSVSVEGERPGQFACLTRELRFWTFTPALRRGIPADSEVELLLRFHSREALPSDSVAPQLLRNSGSSSLTVVRLLQSEDNLDQLEHRLRWVRLHKDGPLARIVQGAIEVADNWTLSARKDLEISH